MADLSQKDFTLLIYDIGDNVDRLKKLYGRLAIIKESVPTKEMGIIQIKMNLVKNAIAERTSKTSRYKREKEVLEYTDYNSFRLDMIDKAVSFHYKKYIYVRQKLVEFILERENTVISDAVKVSYYKLVKSIEGRLNSDIYNETESPGMFVTPENVYKFMNVLLAFANVNKLVNKPRGGILLDYEIAKYNDQPAEWHIVPEYRYDTINFSYSNYMDYVMTKIFSGRSIISTEIGGKILRFRMLFIDRNNNMEVDRNLSALNQNFIPRFMPIVLEEQTTNMIPQMLTKQYVNVNDNVDPNDIRSKDVNNKDYLALQHMYLEAKGILGSLLNIRMWIDPTMEDIVSEKYKRMYYFKTNTQAEVSLKFTTPQVFNHDIIPVMAASDFEMFINFGVFNFGAEITFNAYAETREEYVNTVLPPQGEGEDSVVKDDYFMDWVYTSIYNFQDAERSSQLIQYQFAKSFTYNGEEFNFGQDRYENLQNEQLDQVKKLISNKQADLNFYELSLPEPIFETWLQYIEEYEKENNVEFLDVEAIKKHQALKEYIFTRYIYFKSNLHRDVEAVRDPDHIHEFLQLWEDFFDYLLKIENKKGGFTRKRSLEYNNEEELEKLKKELNNYEGELIIEPDKFYADNSLREFFHLIDKKRDFHLPFWFTIEPEYDDAVRRLLLTNLQDRMNYNPRAWKNWLLGVVPLFKTSHEYDIATKKDKLDEKELELTTSAREKRRKVGNCKTTKGSIEYLYGECIQSVKCKEGECFIACVISTLRSRKINTWQYRNRCVNSIDRNMKSLHGEGVCGGFSLTQLENLCNFMEISISVYGFIGEDAPELTDLAIYNNKKSKHEMIDLVLYKNHYYRYIGRMEYETSIKGWYCTKCWKYFKKTKNQHTCYTRCIECGVPIKDLSNHRCNLKKKAWNIISRIDKKGKKRVLGNCRYSSIIDKNKYTAAFDFETITDHEGKLTVYAVGFKNEEIELIFFGLNSMNDFLNYIDTLRVKDVEKDAWVLYGFNNGFFDNHFVIHSLVTRKITPKMVLQNNNNVLSMEWINALGVKIKCSDLRNFTGPGSLKSTCKSFGLSVSKGEFPHKFVSRIQDLNYVGKIPEPKYWGLRKREKFLLFGSKDLEVDLYEVPDNYSIDEENWNLKQECTIYLKKDIECTWDLYKALSNQFYENFKVDIRDFMTLPQMGYSMWATTIAPNTNLKNDLDCPIYCNVQPTLTHPYIIYLPNEHLNRMAVLSSYGGRVGVYKKLFISHNYEKIIKGQVKFDDMKDDYIEAIDVVSLYPTGMKNYKYPGGYPYHCHEEYKENLNELKEFNEQCKLNIYKQHKFEYLGIWRIKYIAPKDLLLPILPKKKVKEDKYGRFHAGGLSWDLEDGEGLYTSIDIEMALEQGYQIQASEGVFWKQSYHYFENYIDEMYRIKEEGEIEKNKTKKAIGKLGCNAVYGKMLQKAILEEIKIIKSDEEARKFIGRHDILSIFPYEYINMDGNPDRSCLFRGIKPEVEPQINKPSQMGAFVLSYSRRVMYDYFKILGYFNRNDSIGEQLINFFYYGDTDSIHLEMSDEIKKKLGSKYHPSNLGSLYNDDKDNLGKIIFAIYLSPKTYYYESLGKDNKIRQTIKCKGQPADQISKDNFIEALYEKKTCNISRNVLKKTGSRPGTTERTPFSIYEQPLSRIFGKSEWTGRIFLDDHSYSSVPLGFDENLLDF